MPSSRKCKSVDARDGFGTEDAMKPGIERPPSGAGHRRRSSIPKPSPNAPLFRSDQFDRFYSKIPYPTNGGKLYYDLLTGEAKLRKTRAREPTPRGGLSNLTTLAESRQNKQKCSGSTRDEMEREVESRGGVDPVMTDEEGLGSNEEECPRTPNTSDISRLSTFVQYDRSPSVSSQSTFLVCGSDMTELDEWESGSDGHSRRSSIDSDLFFDDRSSASDLPAFKPLPPTLLLECIESEKKQNEESRARDPRLLSASEMYSCNGAQIEEKKGGIAASPSSTIPTSRSSVYKVGCFRRRPQIPVAESSDDEEAADEKSVDDSVIDCSMSSDTKKKRSSRRALISHDAAARKMSSRLTPSEMSDDNLDGFSVQAQKSTQSASHASIHHLLNGDTPDEWYRHCTSGCFPSEKVAAKDKISSLENEQRSNPLTRWFRKTVGASLRTLAVASSVAFVYIFSDQQFSSDKESVEAKGSSHGALEFGDNDDDDDNDEEFYFNPCFCAPHTPMSQGFPSSLLESVPDAAVSELL